MKNKIKIHIQLTVFYLFFMYLKIMLHWVGNFQYWIFL